MRILIIYQYYMHKDEGGFSRFNKIASHWASIGHDVSVVSGMVDYKTGKKYEDFKGKLFSRYNDGNVRVIRAHVSKLYNKGSLGRVWGYFSFMITSLIVSFFLEKYDIVLVSSPPLNLCFTGMLIKWIKGSKFVFEVRDLWPDSAIQIGMLKNRYLIGILRNIESVTYRNADLIVSLTDGIKDVLVEKQIRIEKIVTVPNGADFDLLTPGLKQNSIREKYSLEGKFVVLYIGAIGNAMGLEQVLFAAKILESYNDIMFLVVGDGMAKNNLIYKADEMKLGNIHFLDTVPKTQVGKYINASDVCLAVLKKCNVFKTVYPNKIFDYMTCKRPIILGIEGVAKELIERNHAGLCVTPENHEEIAQAILKYYYDNELCTVHGENGYQLVRKKFDRLKLSEQYLKAIEQIVENDH